jgi:hypothetical protein
MSIQDKFESNSSGCLQLTDRAVVETWQTSSTLNEAERKEWSLIRDLAIQKLEDYPDYRTELKDSVKNWLTDLASISLKPASTRTWSDNRVLNRAQSMLKSYAGPDKDGACEDGLINWIHEERMYYSRAPLMGRATRLRKKGVTSLKDLKRTKPGRDPSYYQDLNAYAVTMNS